MEFLQSISCIASKKQVLTKGWQHILVFWEHVWNLLLAIASSVYSLVKNSKVFSLLFWTGKCYSEHVF